MREGGGGGQERKEEEKQEGEQADFNGSKWRKKL